MSFYENTFQTRLLKFFFWMEDFIEINKRQKTHHIHKKYTIYIE